MKKIAITPFLLLFMLTGFTQSESGTELGLKVGFGSSNQKNAYGITPQFKNGEMTIGFDTGVFAEIPLNERFHFRPEFDIATRGFNAGRLYDRSNNLLAERSIYRFVYMNVPLKFLYTMPLGSGHAFLGVGPYAGWLVTGSYISYDLNGESRKITIGNGSSAQYKPFDFGITSSIGYRLKGKVIIGLDQYTGLSDVTPNMAGKTHNIAWIFYLGYVFKSNNE